MVIGTPCAGSGMLTAGTVRSCCEGAAGKGVICCSGAPDSVVTCAGGADSFVIFDFPWGTSVSVTGEVNGVNPCGSGVS